jgi:SAM-dependent methyltransferase
MTASTTWNPDSYAKNARFVSDLGAPLLELLAPKSGELILDLGCGDGALMEKIVASGSAAFGVDASVAQLQAARRRGLAVAAMDGHHLAVKAIFDAVFSNAALHWMKQPERVVEGIARALKPGGRFVGEFGGKGNVETIRTGLHAALRKRNIDPWTVDPWYYASAEEYTQLLERFRFTVGFIELIPRPTKLPGDISGWLEVFVQSFTQSVRETERKDFLEEVRRELEPRLHDGQGNWLVDYVRLRFHATRDG